MQSNFGKSLEKIFSSLDNVNRFSKALIKYGTLIFILVFAVGCVLAVLNLTVLDFNVYRDFVAKSIVKTSFTLLAEAVIGGLIIDYVINK